jgi:hypothetical protein
LLRFVLLLLGGPLLAHGAEGLYYASRNLQLVTVACDHFMQAPPEARWLRVTGCDIDYTHPAFNGSGDRLSELFFAMRLRGVPASAPASLIVATRDPQALAIAQQGVSNGSQADEEAFTVAMLRVVDLLRAAREVDGYARNGLVERARARRALAGSGAPLAPDGVVLDLHTQPSLIRPGIEAVVGFALVGAGVLRRRRTEAAAGTAAGGLAIVLERRLPPAMLLNLPADDASQIEYAPPLGNPQEVAARIASVLGPVADEGNGRFSVGGDGWRLGFDFGPDDTVWTAAVDTRGSDVSIVALDTLARETGWRVFVPRLGTFR